MKFRGFNEDTYRFLIELSLNNNKLFFDANKQRYIDNVKTPMLALAEDLQPTMLRIDPDFNLKPSSVVSRIYRDARRTHGKEPYRDHAWLGFKHPQDAVSDCFSMYFEIEPSGYGYGMGCYAATPALMRPVREHMLADPAGFLALAESPKLSRFQVVGESYKRDHFPDAPEALKPYLNRKGFSWCYFHADTRPTMDASAFFEEIKTAMLDMAALYQFITLSFLINA